jgi:hypothetical protein
MFKGFQFILAHVNKLVGKGNWKIMQMKFILHVLSRGCPMLEYESLYELFRSLIVPNNLSMHGYDTISWVLVEFM